MKLLTSEQSITFGRTSPVADEIHTRDSEIQLADSQRDKAFFEALLANSGDVATVLDKNGIISYHSPGLKEMLGVDPADAISIHAADTVHRDDHDHVVKQIERCTATPGIQLTEKFRLGHIDGGWVWVEAKIRNLLDDPNIRGILVVCRDITDQVRLKEQMSMAEKTTAFGLFRWDAQTLRTDVSEASTGMLGLKAGDTNLSVRQFFSVIHPDDVDLVRDIFVDVVATKTPFVKTVRVLHKKGEYRHFSAHGFPEFDDDRNVTAVAGVIEDVTSDIQTRKSLRESEAQYRLIAEHAHDIFARHDPEGKLTFLSPAAREVLGVNPDDMIGLDIVQFMHPDDQDQVRDKIATLGASTGSIRLTFRLSHIDGHYIWSESTVQAIYSEETGKMTEAIAITRDISERKEHEQNLLDARERAEEANRTKSTFLANMSHELRTPLNAIIGFSEILKREMYGPLGDENYADYVGLIFDSGTHLLDLINDILDMSKIEAGKMEISLHAIDVEDIAQNCLKVIEPRASAKGQSLVLDNMLVDDHDSALGDVRATKQVLLNLLSNAVKFTGEGGTIRIVLQRREDEIELCVEDDGVGIAPEDIPRLMQPFEQVVGQSTIAEEGSGLGLALTRSFCELQGGRFTLQNIEQGGTRAVVMLPMSSGPVAASALKA